MAQGNSDNLPQLAKFRRQLQERALAELETRNPRYVTEFRKKMGEEQDLSEVIKQTEPLLGTGIGIWAEFLTAIRDLEQVLDEVRRSLALLSITPIGTSEILNPGAWTIYHFHHWIFQMHALLERVDRIVNLTCRKLIKAKSKNWRQIQSTLTKGNLNKMHDRLGKIRDPLAHGAGIEIFAVGEEKLWGAYLLCYPGEGSDILNGFYDSVAPLQQSWNEHLRTETAMAVTEVEDIMGELNKHAF